MKNKITEQVFEEMNKTEMAGFGSFKVTERIIEITLKQVCNLIDNRINIQKKMLKKQPLNEKSIAWRIIGFQELKKQLGGSDE